MADERGGVLIIVAVTLPVLLLFASFVLDTANWWVHKKHLQTQADAGALAASQNFRFPTCDSAIDGSIASVAQQYAGISGTPVFNEQVGQNQLAVTGDNDVAGTGTTPPAATLPPRGVHMQLNSPSFYGRPGTVVDSDLVGNPGPCSAKLVDVKMTETGVPWLFRAAGVDYIDAQARVGIQTADSLAGLLPIGVESVNPDSAHVWLIDEDTGSVLAQADLAKNGIITGGVPYWDNAVGHGGGPMSFNVQSQRIGIRVALSGSSSTSYAGSYATVCDQPMVVCRPDPLTPNIGVTRIRGYTTTNSGTGPPGLVHLEDVTLAPPAGCGAPANGYFSTTCTTTVLHARIVGPIATSGSNKATVNATIEGVNANQIPALTYDSATGTWVSPALPISAVGVGARKIGISWAQNSGTIGTTTCRNGGQNTCLDSYSNVHATFSGSRTASGPIKSIGVSATPLFGATAGVDGHNVPRCTGPSGCVQSFVVEVSVGGNLELQPVTDPAIALRVFGGSHTQSLKCYPNVNTQLRDDIAIGCDAEYAVNHGTPCPTESVLSGLPQPWNCVALRTGTTANDPARGLNRRVYGSENPTGCTSAVQNHWPSYPLGDHRLMPVFLVPFGAFDGNGGNTSVPIVGFAAFYVTGWTGNGGFNPPCRPPNGDELVPGTESDNAVMSGHFVKAALPGNGNGEACDFAAIDACAAVLLK
jgi:hypothetical protein